MLLLRFDLCFFVNEWRSTLSGNSWYRIETYFLNSLGLLLGRLYV